MAQEFTMPKLGLTMTDGTIREWLVAEGTAVAAGDPVLIIETDKVETEVEARIGGIFQPTAAVGENFACGEVIGWLLDEGEAPVGGASAAPATVAPAPAPVAIDTPAPKPPVTVPATNGAAPQADIAARGEGGRILASPRARARAVDVGADLAQIAGTGPSGRIVFDDVEAFLKRVTSDGPPDVAARGEGGRILASPRARHAARTAGVDLSHIAGSGPGGRIVFDDVEAFATRPAPQPAPQAVAPPSTAVPASHAASASKVLATGGARLFAELLGIDLGQVPAASPGSRVTREDVAAWVRVQLAATTVDDEPASPSTVMPLLQEPTSVRPFRGMRGVIAERMHASLTEMAQLTLAIDADMGAVNAERERRRDAELIVPGYTAWVVAAAGRALVDHPYVNSQVTSDGVALLPEVKVGVAVALDDGLIVPVVANANSSEVDHIHGVVADLAGRARTGKLTLADLEGGTFSVTALGMYGVDMFTPVINPPNTAILGVGRLRTETAWHEGQPIPKTVMTLSLTWDHRAFDGAPAAEFAQSIVRYLENPDQLNG